MFDRSECLDERDTWDKNMVEANANIFKLSGDLKLSVSFYKLLLTRKWQQLVAAEDQFYSQAV